MKLASHFLVAILSVILLGCMEQVSVEKGATPQQVEALWSNPSRATSGELLVAAASACRDDLEKSAFLLWCGYVRLQMEEKAYIPKDGDGGSPTLALMAMWQQTSEYVMPVLYCSPEAHKRAIARFRTYRPTFVLFYCPAWSYRGGVSKAEAEKYAAGLVKEVADKLEEVLQLTAVPEYLASLKVYVDWNDRSAGRRERLQAAIETIRRIEQQKGVEAGWIIKPAKHGPRIDPAVLRAALDRVQSGKSVQFRNCVLRVEKRDGDTLEGITLSITEGGRAITTTAPKGTISVNEKGSNITLYLYEKNGDRADTNAPGPATLYLLYPIQEDVPGAP